MGSHQSATFRFTKGTGLALTACGPLLLVGVALHPHAPGASTMPEVVFAQTGQTDWWPAHVLLVVGYAAFALFLVGLARAGGLPDRLAAVVRVTLPLAWLCTAGMVAHLLLPVGHDSVANGTYGWIMWVDSSVQISDAIWSLTVAAVAWALVRVGVQPPAVGALGMLGGVILALFALAIPLTGTVIPVDAMHAVVPAAPMAGVLLVMAWTVGTGVGLLRGARGSSPRVRLETGVS